jgi:hypothetical protein
MKTKILCGCFFLLIVFNSATAQILTNGGFENWTTGPSSYLDPVGWITSNGIGIGASVVQAPGRTGVYSANLLTVLDSNSQVNLAGLGFIYNGNLKPLVLSGYWKGNFLASNDFLYVSIIVRDASFTEIGFGSAYSPILTNVTNWTPFSATINYTSSNTPAQTIIQFTLFSTSLNTTGFVDDLTLTNTTANGIAQTSPLSGSSLSRDFSGNYFLNLDLASPQSFTLNIFSAEGRVVSKNRYELAAGKHNVPLLTQELAQGVYFCRVVTEGIEKSLKFIK